MIQTIGFLGGGQLARMSALAAYRLGFKVAVFESIADSPAGVLTKLDFPGSINDDHRLKEFAEACDIITLENEFIDPARLELLQSFGKDVFPSPYTISHIQDKLIQKQTFKSRGLPVPDFIPVTNSSSYDSLSAILGAEFLLKSRKMGYDGYGNHFVANSNDFAEGMGKLTSRHDKIMAERKIEFVKELAVMVAINSTGTAVYPVVETIQENHICKLVIAPADISLTTRQKVEMIAIEAVKSVNGKGIFGIELFLTADEDVFINEIAPRPHNSGHYTIEGCVTSQFENHIRSILDLPLGDTSLVDDCSVMINTLGKNPGEGKIMNYTEILTDPNVHLHFYGKSESRKGRKMGHMTMNGNNVQEVISILEKLEKEIIIGKSKNE
jgi:5-(carboxyamino)imidazole ribonucleotide synthase